METWGIIKEKIIMKFGELKGGQLFIDNDPASGGDCVMLKLHPQTIEDIAMFAENLFNAVFTSDGSVWNFDDDDLVTVVKQATLEY